MIASLSSIFSGGPFYVRFGKRRLWVRNVRTRREFDDEPLIGLSLNLTPTVQAYGKAARSKAYTVVNPFSHDRVVLADFDLAEKLLRHAFKVVSGNRLLRASPVAIMHPIDRLDGGLSKIERRALLELAESAGARQVHVWEGRELTDNEVSDGFYES